MDLTKQNITKTLEKVNMSGSKDDIVSSGILKNVQVFGDQVDIYVIFFFDLLFKLQTIY